MKTKPTPKPKPATATPIAEGVRKSLDPALIDAHPHNRAIDPKTCKGLADSMRLHGQIQPATVRPHPDKKGRYQLGAGARRWHAAKLAKVPLDCIIRDLSDAEIEAMLAIENHQRENPDPKQEAAQIRRFMQSQPDAKPATLAAMLGRDEAWVKRRCRLLDLLDPVHDAWQDPTSKLHALPIASMELIAQLDNEKQMTFLEEFGEGYDMADADTVTHWIASIACALDKVDWLDNPATFIPGCGPGCATTQSAGDLFAATEFTDHPRLRGCQNCLKPECFNKRKALARNHTWQTVIARAPKSFYATTHSHRAEDVILADQSTLKPRSKWDFRDWKACKKSDPAAKAFIEEDNDEVKLTWKTPPKDAETVPKASSESGVKTVEETQQASIDRVMGKRLTLVLDELKEHVDHAPPPVINPLMDDADGTAAFDAQIHALLRLAAVFGTQHHCSTVNHLVYDPDEPDDEESDTVDSPAGNKTWSDYANVTVKGAIERLWRQIRGVFKTRLRDRSYTERKSDLIKPEFQLEMLQIARLTGFDYPAAMARAITAVKVPGSLQNLDPVTWKPKTAAKT
jgi:ParB/RepB/Spo0J family partition protein